MSCPMTPQIITAEVAKNNLILPTDTVEVWPIEVVACC